METAPPVSARVLYCGGFGVGCCTGVVTNHYPIFNDDSFMPLAESEWHIEIKPDNLPGRWAYKGFDTFESEVKKLRMLNVKPVH